MKKLLLTIGTLLTLQISINAQNVDYKVLRDEPNDGINLMVAVNALGMDMGISNIGGATLLGAGLAANANIKNKFGADFTFNYGYLTLATIINPENVSNSTKWLELGGFYNFYDKTKASNLPVVLSTKKTSNSTYETTTTKYINVAAHKRIMMGARGGIITHSFPLDINSYNPIVGLSSKYLDGSNSGIYLGGQIITVKNLFVSTDSYGICQSSKTIRLYLDIMYLPVWSAKFKDVDYKDKLVVDSTVVGTTFPSALAFSSLGWRCGLIIQPTENRDGAGSGKPGSLYARMEFGQRPVEGSYFSFGMGFTIARKKIDKFK
ncbi:MAG: hypothetical protein ACOYMA_08725 [Bacteroidia bacterium]